MYSRIPRQPPRPVGVPSKPASGQTVYRRAVTPPPNYSGNMFSPDGVFPDGSPLSAATAGDLRPHFDGLPSVSGLSARGADRPPEEEPTEPPASVPSADTAPVAEATEPVPASPVLLDRAHFPLGHGLGEEELLLLGLILFLLHEDRSAPPTDGDNDLFLTILILGFLLFCG